VVLWVIGVYTIQMCEKKERRCHERGDDVVCEGGVLCEMSGVGVCEDEGVMCDVVCEEGDI
jgi:hypothetical protein